MKEATTEARLFTVGHSNHSLETFLGLLHQHRITAVADLRSVPFSRYVPHFNRDALARSLERAGIRHVYLGEELGAIRSEPECYSGGRVSYELVAQSPLFLRGIDRVRKGLESFRVALMCAEKDPLTCHRSVLVCRHLKGLVDPIVHILDDGRLEPHAEVEDRLLKLFGLHTPNLFLSRDDLVEQAYQQQAERLAYVASTDEEGEQT